MNKIVALAFVIVGVILVIFGCGDHVSTVGGISRALIGAPNDTSVWLLIAGLLAAITGIFGFTDNHSSKRF